MSALRSAVAVDGGAGEELLEIGTEAGDCLCVLCFDVVKDLQVVLTFFLHFTLRLTSVPTHQLT